MTEADTSNNVIAERIVGTIKWFNFTNGYGFIQPVDPQQECIFVHKSAFVIKYGSQLKYTTIVGKFLEFDVIAAEKGSIAANVTGIGGLPLFEIYQTKFKFDRRKRVLKFHNIFKFPKQSDDDINNNYQFSEQIISNFGRNRWLNNSEKLYHPYKRNRFFGFYAKQNRE